MKITGLGWPSRSVPQQKLYRL